MHWIIGISILIFFEIIADVLAKNWSLKGHWLLAVGALSAYLLGNLFWLFALKNGAGLARGTIIFSIISALLTVSLGIFIYKETLSPHQSVGIGFGVLAIIFLFWE